MDGRTLRHFPVFANPSSLVHYPLAFYPPPPRKSATLNAHPNAKIPIPNVIAINRGYFHKGLAPIAVMRKFLGRDVGAKSKPIKKLDQGRMPPTKWPFFGSDRSSFSEENCPQLGIALPK
jgi:hypothetical protein